MPSKLFFKLEISMVFQIIQRLRINSWSTYFSGNMNYVFPGITLVTCVKFGQWDETRARKPSKRLKIILSLHDDILRIGNYIGINEKAF